MYSNAKEYQKVSYADLLSRKYSSLFTDDLMDRISHREARFFNRQACLIIDSISNEGREILRSFQSDRIGIYSICQKNWALSGPLVEPLLFGGKFPEDNVSRYLKLHHDSKLYFKTAMSLTSAMLGMELKIRGPLMNFQNSKWATLHALMAACFDIQEGKISLAVVAGAFCPDIFSALELRERDGIETSVESSAVCFLTQKSNLYNKIVRDVSFLKEITKNSSWIYGVNSPLMCLMGAR